MTTAEFDAWAEAYRKARTSCDRAGLLLRLRKALPMTRAPRRSVKTILDDYYSRAASSPSGHHTE